MLQRGFYASWVFLHVGLAPNTLVFWPKGSRLEHSIIKAFVSLIIMASVQLCLHGAQDHGTARRLPSLSNRGQQQCKTAARAAKLPNNSFDADDELDKDLAEELSRFRSPDAWNQVAQHLDLVWTVGRSRGKRAVCTCCQGSGEDECQWCHGTGAMMVGDTLFRSADGGSHCPVCKGKGYVPCENCRGTGYRASWLQGPDQCKNPHAT